MIRITSFGQLKNPWRDRLIERTRRLVPFEWNEIPLKRCPDKRGPQLLPEERAFLASVKNFHLADVKGKAMDSDQFSKWLFGSASRHLVVGPAIGFHEDFFKQAASMISLSSLTLTHELAQVLLAESVYRSACILKNHPFVK